MLKKLEYLLVRFFYEVFRHIPFSISHYLAKFIAFFMHRVIRYRKDLVKQNLSIAFPELNKKQLKQTIADVYYSSASLVVELLQSWRVNEDFCNKNFTVHNRDVFEEAVAENKGLILLTGHLANFEWAGSYACSEAAIDIHAVMKPIHNTYINNFIVVTREKLGFRLLYTRAAYKQGLEVLKQEGIVGLIADQDAGRKGIFVDFFGIPSSTAKGAALLHLKTGAPIIVGINIRKGWGKFDLYCERVPSCKDLELTEENIFRITQAHTKILENWVRKYPGQYLWTHKRWKTKPNVQQLEKFHAFNT